MKIKELEAELSRKIAEIRERSVGREHDPNPQVVLLRTELRVQLETLEAVRSRIMGNRIAINIL